MTSHMTLSSASLKYNQGPSLEIAANLFELIPDFETLVGHFVLDFSFRFILKPRVYKYKVM